MADESWRLINHWYFPACRAGHVKGMEKKKRRRSNTAKISFKATLPYSAPRRQQDLCVCQWLLLVNSLISERERMQSNFSLLSMLAFIAFI